MKTLEMAPQIVVVPRSNLGWIDAMFTIGEFVVGENFELEVARQVAGKGYTVTIVRGTDGTRTLRCVERVPRDLPEPRKVAVRSSSRVTSVDRRRLVA